MPIVIISDAESHRASACMYLASLICQNEKKKKKKRKKLLLHQLINSSKIRRYPKKMY